MVKTWLRRRRIGVLLGGRSGERPISLKTGDAIWQSLRRQGFRAVKLDAAKNLPRLLSKNKIDFAYIALHGPGGEDGAVQGFLEQLQIPYTGSGILASALAMDKIASKRLFETAGLPTAKWFSVRAPSPGLRPPSPRGEGTLLKEFPLLGERVKGEGVAVASLGFPLVVKPADQGSALGVSIVHSLREWKPALKKSFRYSPIALAEAFLKGPEITVGVLGDQPLPVIEIVPSDDRPFYDFHAKYAPGGSRHLLPARISRAAAKRSTELSLAACRLLGVRGAARVDLIVDRRRGPVLLEVNTIPGMTETSLLPEAARAAGISFDALVLKIAELSLHGPAL